MMPCRASLLALVPCLTLLVPARPARAAEQIVTLGDSLSFAYEAEFGFKVTIQFFGTFGDGFGPEVRNWIEILSNPAFRNARFDQGARDDFELLVSFLPPATQTMFFRNACNWAIPGLKIDQLRRFMAGEATLFDLLGDDPDFSILVTALQYSDFDEDADFALADLEDQIAHSAERLTLFIGGNDIRGVYGTIYGGGPPGTFVDDFLADATAILDRVQQLNPAIQVVLVNVPHVGITPDVKADFPTDPVATARVTAVLRDLNARLAALAASRGIGCADIFTPTLGMLGAAPLCIHGLTFSNSGTATGDLGHVWLNGPLSANFHPNTNAHALVANAVIDAFNEAYQTGIAPLTATEILGNLLGKSAAEVDLPFADWMAGHGLAGRPETDDSDHDGVPAGVEFAAGLNPTLHDGARIRARLVDSAGQPALELAYPVRLPGSARCSLRPAAGPAPDALAPFATPPTPGADGLARALLPADGTRGFIRLEALLAAP